MLPRLLLKAVSVLLGLFFAAAAGGAILALNAGTFTEGRRETLFMSVLMVLLSGTFLLFPLWPRVSRVIGITSIVVLAAMMLFMVFSQPLSKPSPGIYQLAAIALAVLLIARFVLAIRRAPPRDDA